MNNAVHILGARLVFGSTSNEIGENAKKRRTYLNNLTCDVNTEYSKEQTVSVRWNIN